MSERISSITIPNDLAACQALVEQLMQTVGSQSATIAQLRKDQEALKLTITELLQRAFARRSERCLHDPNQLKIDFNDTPEAADAASGLAEAVDEADVAVQSHVRHRRRTPRSEDLPQHLPRYEVEAAVPEDMQHCPQHGARKLIGYDSTETLEFERPKLRVRVTKYPKYACENQPQCGVTSPERPTGLIEGDLKDVLDQLLAGETDYDELRPDVWATAHPEAIRQYRVEERRDKADRKQTRRAARRLISQAHTA